MFTGIIREIGILEKIEKKPGGVVSFSIRCKKNRPKIGDSVSVNGVCLTATAVTKNGFTTDVVPETLKRTNLGFLEKDSTLNLEPSLKASDLLSGHLVMGHVDGVGTVKKISRGFLDISSPPKLMKFIAEKGSVAVNGVSLTVADRGKNSFSAAVIPFTAKHTNLGILKKGDRVNIEVDVVARYILNLRASLSIKS